MRRAAGRAVAKVAGGALAGGTLGYTLGWSVADAMLAGGALGGAGGRMAKMASAMKRKALVATAKMISGSGRGVAAGYVASHAMMSTPYGVDEDKNSHKGKTEEELFRLRKDQVLKHTGQYALDAATHVLEPVREISPELAKAFVDDAVRKANYLANVVPKDPPWASFDPDYAPSSEEIRKFAEVFETVMNPNAFIEKFEDGYVTPETAKAFRETSPGLFSTVAAYVFQTVDLTKLDEETGQNLSMLLDCPLTANLQCVQDLQMDFMQDAPGQAQAQGSQAIKGAVGTGEAPTAAATSTER
jgi:hypothetical protein